METVELNGFVMNGRRVRPYRSILNAVSGGHDDLRERVPHAHIDHFVPSGKEQGVGSLAGVLSHVWPCGRITQDQLS